jgi:hypothetical protein
MAKHFHLDITDTDRIDTEAALDWIYVLRTTAIPADLDTAATAASKPTS